MPQAVCVTGAALLPPIGAMVIGGLIGALVYGLILIGEALFSPEIWEWILLGLIGFLSVAGGMLLCVLWYTLAQQLFQKCHKYWHPND